MKITFGKSQDKKIAKVLDLEHYGTVGVYREPARRGNPLERNPTYYRLFGWDLVSYGEVMFENIPKDVAIKLQHKLRFKDAKIVRSHIYDQWLG